MRRILIMLAALLVTLLAYSNVALATGLLGYQPEAPDKLLKR